MEHFIGKITLQGLFAGVLTSASMAIAAHEGKLRGLFKLIISDELNKQQQGEQIAA